MARRSLRSSATTTPQKRSSPAVTPGSSNRLAKRPKPTPTDTSTASSASKTRVTPKRSPHFSKQATEQEDDNEEEYDDLEPSSPSSSEDEASGYEDEDGADEASASSEEEEEAEPSSSEDEGASKRRRKSGGRTSVGKADKKNGASKLGAAGGKKGQELWRPSVKTGLGPGTQVLIEKPKPREAGKTPYTDDTIHPNTMLFLKDLAANNDREWLKMHDPDYRQSWNDFTAFLESLTPKIIEIDETIPELPLKDIFFRIYRDVRFSSDPTPYKAHFSAAWSRTGRKGPFACYYIHIQPGHSFAGGGLWHPEAAPVQAMRRNIDRRPERIKQVLLDPGMRKEFLGGVPNDEKKAVAAFVKSNSDNALKTKPKGYDADHENIELLRLRNYTLGCKLSDDEVVGPNGIERISTVFRRLEPLVTYINSVVMPDDANSDGESGEEGE